MQQADNNLELREANDAPNKSMDVRAKQLLSYHVVLFPFACVAAVSPHVNAVVSRFLVKRDGLKI